MNIYKLLERHEGFVEHAYQDSEGYWTIGIGRLIDKRRGGRITKDEAYYLLNNDIKRFEQELDHSLPWWRNESKIRQMALLDMAFNLGVPSLLAFENMLSAWQKGDYETAANEAMDSKWARQVKSRAYEVAQMILTDSLEEI